MSKLKSQAKKTKLPFYFVFYKWMSHFVNKIKMKILKLTSKIIETFHKFPQWYTQTYHKYCGPRFGLGR